MTTLYIVVQYWSGGARKMVGAYFKEDNARYAASKLVGTAEGALIGLETVELKDTDPR